MPGIRTLLLAGWMTVAALPSVAEVVDAADNGFTVRHEFGLVAPPETAWRMLIGHIGEWWDSDHTYSGDASNLYIEARPLGCFCERLSQSDAVVHLTVTVIRENSLLRLTGGLGPLGLMGVDGNMTLSLGSDERGTRIAMQYQVGGYSPDGLAGMAPAVDAMLGNQLARFVRFVETGSPVIVSQTEPPAVTPGGDSSPAADEEPQPPDEAETLPDTEETPGEDTMSLSSNGQPLQIGTDSACLSAAIGGSLTRIETIAESSRRQ